MNYANSRAGRAAALRILQDADELTALAVNARNLALAEQQGLPLLTVCNTCTLMLRQAKVKLDGGRREEVNGFLKKANVNYRGSSEVTHLLWVLVKDYGLKKLQSRLVRPLTGLKVAGYYGCHLLRPPEVMDFEEHVNPRSLEDLIIALGATPVDFAARLDCCGFHATYTAEADGHRLTGQINRSAILADADCLVTPCPLCQMQLDMFQPEGRRAVGNHPELPVLHLAQLVGLALGLSPRELGMHRHVITATRLAI